jgi:hypothetical protein
MYALNVLGDILENMPNNIYKDNFLTNEKLQEEIYERME